MLSSKSLSDCPWTFAHERLNARARLQALPERILAQFLMFGWSTILYPRTKLERRRWSSGVALLGSKFPVPLFCAHCNRSLVPTMHHGYCVFADFLGHGTRSTAKTLSHMAPAAIMVAQEASHMGLDAVISHGIPDRMRLTCWYLRAAMLTH